MMRTRLTACALALGALAAGGCGDGSGPADGAGSEGAGIEVFGPGLLLGRFPADPEPTVSDTLLEGALELAVDDSAIYVLDQMASVVWHLDLDGRPLARLGRPGPGPEELDDPVSIRPVPGGGVWVAQPRAGRLTRFDPDGAARVPVRTPFPAVNFGVLRDGRPVVPTMDAATLFQAIAGDGSTEILSISEGPLPETLRRGPQDRLSFRALRVATLADGGLAVLQNRHGADFSLWRLAPGGDDRMSVRVGELPLPRWLYEMLEEETERTRASLSEEFATGDFMIPFNGLHSGEERVWLAPAPSHRALAIGVPLTADRPVHVVVPGDDEHAGLLDAAVVGDRIVALYRTEVRVYALEPVAESRFSRPGG